MKITIEIGPSRVTRFLGARATNVANGAILARHKVKSVFLRIRAAGKALVTKVPSPEESKAVS
jgi:hypothetical protein